MGRVHAWLFNADAGCARTFSYDIQKTQCGFSSQEDINKYLILPGILMYAAGQWIVNLNYWGCNQYITQRALGADLNTARNGLLFAALLKLIMPLIVMLPGIAAYVLVKQGHLHPLEKMDDAYALCWGFCQRD